MIMNHHMESEIQFWILPKSEVILTDDPKDEI